MDKALEPSSAPEAASVDSGGGTAETEGSRSGKMTRRRAIAIGGAAAAAAIGLIAGVRAAITRGSSIKNPLSVSCAISDSPQAAAGAAVIDIDDDAGMLSYGISPTNARASFGLDAPERPSHIDGITRYARFSATGLEPGAAYLANVRVLGYEPLEGRGAMITGLVDRAATTIVAEGTSAQFDIPFQCDGTKNLKASPSITLLETI